MKASPPEGGKPLPTLPEGWQKDAIDMVVDFFEDMNFPQSIRCLEIESGHVTGQELAAKELQFVRGLILDGMFEDVLTFLRPLQMKLQDGAKRVLYEVQLQQFLELLEAHSGQDKQKVDILVMELANLEALCPPADFHQLCFCLTLPNVQDHPNFKTWTVHGGRRMCNEVVQSALEPLFPTDGLVPAHPRPNAQRDPNRRTLQSILQKAMAYDTMRASPPGSARQSHDFTAGKANWLQDEKGPQDNRIRAAARPHTTEGPARSKKARSRPGSLDDLPSLLPTACHLADTQAREIGSLPDNARMAHHISIAGSLPNNDHLARHGSSADPLPDDAYVASRHITSFPDDVASHGFAGDSGVTLVSTADVSPRHIGTVGSLPSDSLASQVSFASYLPDDAPRMARHASAGNLASTTTGIRDMPAQATGVPCDVTGESSSSVLERQLSGGRDSPAEAPAAKPAYSIPTSRRPSPLRVPPPLTTRERSSDARKQQPPQPPTATSPRQPPVVRIRSSRKIERTGSLEPPSSAKASEQGMSALERTRSDPPPSAPKASNPPPGSRPMGPITREFRRGYCMDVIPPPPEVPASLQRYGLATLPSTSASSSASPSDVAPAVESSPPLTPSGRGRANEDLSKQQLEASFGLHLLSRAQQREVEKKEKRGEGRTDDPSSSTLEKFGSASASLSRRASLNSGESSDGEVASTPRGGRAGSLHSDAESARPHRRAHLSVSPPELAPPPNRRSLVNVAAEPSWRAPNDNVAAPPQLSAPPGRKSAHANVDPESEMPSRRLPGSADAQRRSLTPPPGHGIYANAGKVDAGSPSPHISPLPGRRAHFNVDPESAASPGRRPPGAERGRTNGAEADRARRTGGNADVDRHRASLESGPASRGGPGESESERSAGDESGSEASRIHPEPEQIMAKQKRVGQMYRMLEPYSGFTSTVVIKDIQPLRALAWDRSTDASFLAIGSNSRALRVFEVTGVVGMHGVAVHDEGGSPAPQVESERVGEQHNWHLGSIYAVDWNSRGTLIATASNDHTVKVARAVHDGTAPLRLDCGASDSPYVEGGIILEGHGGTVRDVGFSPIHENQLISGGAGDCDLRLWDVAAEVCTAQLQGHTDTVYAARMCADGRSAVSGAGDGVVRLWDLRSSSCTHALPAHSAQVSSVAVEETLQWVVAGHEDGSCRILDLRSLQETRRLSHHTADCRTMDISPGGRWLLTGGFDHAVSIIDIQYGWRLAGLWRLHPDKVITTRWHPNGLGFATSSADRTVCVWSPAIISRKIREHLS